MDLHLILPVGLVVGLAATLQSAVGFGFGLLSIPLLVWLGLPLPQAISLGMGVIICQTGWGVYQYRDHNAWLLTLPVVIARVVGLPLGVLALVELVGFGPGHIKQVIGLILLFVLLLLCGLHIKPRQHIHPAWGTFAGFCGGVLGGLSGMGGAPVVLWAFSHDWHVKRTRAVMWTVFVFTIPVQMALYTWQFGLAVLIAFAIGLGYFPLALGCSSLGMKLGSLMSRQRLRRVAFGLLTIVALLSISAGWW